MSCKHLLVALAVSHAMAACHGASPERSSRAGAGFVNAPRTQGVAGSPANGAAGADNPRFPVVQAPAPQSPAAASPNAGMAMPKPPAPIPTDPVFIDHTGSDNPAGLSAADVKTLMAGGPVGQLRIVYPYAGTVFPRGLLPPVVMWEGEAGSEVVYLHLHSRSFDYKGILKAGLVQGFHSIAGTGAALGMIYGKQQQPQVALPSDVWELAGRATLDKADPFTLELTVRANGRVVGPIVTQFVIAQANLRGSIYYGTFQEFDSANGNDVLSGGKIIRIPPSGKAELVTSTSDGCYGCHTVSANGSRIIAHRSPSPALMFGMPLMGNAVSFQLSWGGISNLKGTPVGPRGSYSAVYPDGSKYLATSMHADVGGQGLFEPLGTPRDAKLFDAVTGQIVNDTGIPPGAVMPNFSPDGSLLAFNDVAIDTAHGIALMNYDVRLDKASGYRIVTGTNPGDVMRPAFPVITPDNKAIVFARTNGVDFTTGELASQGALVWNGEKSSSIKLASSDLFIVDLQSRKVTVLAKAMGFNTPDDYVSGATYLPYGENDLHSNYNPTVFPAALGSYFWVFFDSWRNFGNLGLQRQLWGAAIDIHPDGKYEVDPSYPPFYLPGQMLGSNNRRAFAALDPCRKDGEPCASGLECCAGACGASGVCAPPPPERVCAKLDERCTTKADCCVPPGGTEYDCIAGFCAFIQLL